MALSTALPSIPISNTGASTTDPIATRGTRQRVMVHGGIIIGGGAGTVTLQSWDGTTATDLTGAMVMASGQVIPLGPLKTLPGGGLRVVTTGAGCAGYVYATPEAS